jgi:hypothetical protein
MTARLPGLIASAMLAAVATFYTVEVFVPEDHHDGSGRVIVFASVVVLAAGLAAIGSLFDDPYWRRLTFGIALAIAFVCMWLTGLSIGPLFFPAVVLLAYAFGRG